MTDEQKTSTKKPENTENVTGLLVMNLGDGKKKAVTFCASGLPLMDPSPYTDVQPGSDKPVISFDALKQRANAQCLAPVVELPKWPHVADVTITHKEGNYFGYEGICKAPDGTQFAIPPVEDFPAVTAFKKNPDSVEEAIISTAADIINFIETKCKKETGDKQPPSYLPPKKKKLTPNNPGRPGLEHA